MVKEYIEIDKITFPTPFTINPSDYAKGWNACLKSVMKHKTTDVAPVIHGKWIDALYVEKYGDAYCSECNHFDWSNLNYCSNCGAKMDGGNK